VTVSLTIVDYGAGNLRSVANAFEAIHCRCTIARQPADLAGASAIVLPGVGAFGDCMAQLRALNFVEALNEHVVKRGTPYLGICLGMQLLARKGLEHGDHEGLGWIDGTVERIQPAEDRYRIPHIGWNSIEIARPCPLLDGLNPDPAYYFVHSYHFVPAASMSDCVTSTCWHGARITASVRRDHVFGVQFHPEKSQENGLQLLRNFVRFVETRGT
jgi:imidazole glycerol-phosphate synthase subunit HisH